MKRASNCCVVWAPVLCWKGLSGGHWCVLSGHSTNACQAHTTHSPQRRVVWSKCLVQATLTALFRGLSFQNETFLFWKNAPTSSVTRLVKIHRWLFSQKQIYFVSWVLRWLIMMLCFISYQQGWYINTFPFSDSSYFSASSVYLLNSCPVFFYLHIFFYQFKSLWVETVGLYWNS